jgi:hypothetical protein
MIQQNRGKAVIPDEAALIQVEFDFLLANKVKTV